MTSFIKKIIQKKYNIEDVFTPATSARLTFVKREDAEKQYTKVLNISGEYLRANCPTIPKIQIQNIF